jgi:hypothetical protein
VTRVIRLVFAALCACFCAAPAGAATLEDAVAAVEKTAARFSVPEWERKGATHVFAFTSGPWAILVLDLPPDVSVSVADAWTRRLCRDLGWRPTFQDVALTPTRRRVTLRTFSPLRGAGFNRTQLELPLRRMRDAFEGVGARKPVLAFRMRSGIELRTSAAPSRTATEGPRETLFFGAAAFAQPQLRITFSRPWRPIIAILGVVIGCLLMVASGAAVTSHHWRGRLLDRLFATHVALYRLGLMLLTGFAVYVGCLVLEANWRALDFSIGVGEALTTLGPFPQAAILVGVIPCWQRAMWIAAGGTEIGRRNRLRGATLQCGLGLLSAFALWTFVGAVAELSELWGSGERSLGIVPSALGCFGSLVFFNAAMKSALHDAPAAPEFTSENIARDMLRQFNELLSNSERLREWLDKTAAGFELEQATEATVWDSERSRWLSRGLAVDQAEILARRADERAAEQRLIATFEPWLRAAVTLLGVYSLTFRTVEDENRENRMPWTYAGPAVGFALAVARFANVPAVSLLVAAAGAGVYALIWRHFAERRRGRQLLRERRLREQIVRLAEASGDPRALRDCLLQLEALKPKSRRPEWRLERRLLEETLTG